MAKHHCANFPTGNITKSKPPSSEMFWCTAVYIWTLPPYRDFRLAT